MKRGTSGMGLMVVTRGFRFVLRRLKRGAAAAAPDRIGILDPETGPGEVVRVVDDGTVEKLGAIRGDDHFQPVPLDDFVPFLDMGEAHSILETGTATSLHVDAQPHGGVLLLADKELKLLESWIGDLDHVWKLSVETEGGK